MKKRKNTFAKVMAFIALIAIVLGIIGTGILVLAGGQYGGEVQYSEEEIQAIIDSFSGTTVTGSGEIGENIDTQETGEEITELSPEEVE